MTEQTKAHLRSCRSSPELANLDRASFLTFPMVSVRYRLCAVDTVGVGGPVSETRNAYAVAEIRSYSLVLARTWCDFEGALAPASIREDRSVHSHQRMV